MHVKALTMAIDVRATATRKMRLIGVVRLNIALPILRTDKAILGSGNREACHELEGIAE